MNDEQIRSLNKKIFIDRQSDLLLLANTDIGRFLLQTKDREFRHGTRIIKLTPSSFHIDTGERIKVDGKILPVLKATMFTHERIAKILYPYLTYLDILRKDMQKYAPSQDRASLENFLTHYAGIEQKNLPFIMMIDATIFASAGDGSLQAVNGTYSTARGAATGANNTGTSSGSTFFQGQSNSFDGNFYLTRGFFPFDTSSLEDTRVVQSAAFKLYITSVTDNGAGDPGLIQTTQASISSLADADFDNLTLNSPTEGSARPDYGNWSNNAYNAFTMNASGIGWISLVGNTLLGVRNGNDIDNATPSSGHQNQADCSFSEASGTTQDPKLEVTYVPLADAGMVLVM